MIGGYTRFDLILLSSFASSCLYAYDICLYVYHFYYIHSFLPSSHTPSHFQSGRAMVCSTLVAHLLRAGGALLRTSLWFLSPLLFSLLYSILFCISFFFLLFLFFSSFQLHIFEDNGHKMRPNLPSQCWYGNNRSKLPFCQIAGWHVQDIPFYNSIPPHDHMYEHCSALPPLWKPEPAGC